MIRHFFLFFITTFTFAQQTRSVDFISVHGSLGLDTAERSVRGSVVYTFKVLKPIDTIAIDAVSMIFTDVTLNGRKVNYKNSGKALKLYQGFKKGTNSLAFEYHATPKQTLYFIGEKDNLQIWTQGQGKYTSHWFPSFDDVNEKVIFSLDIDYDKAFEVISNGILKHSGETTGSSRHWSYAMDKPMSSYLLMLAIGKFEKQVQASVSGIPIEMYYQPEDAAKFEPTYRYSKIIFDFLEKETGVRYPWKIYRHIPVRDFLYGGMENTSATIFAQDYVVDAIGFNDRNYINVSAHELAHQWFGDLITAKTAKDHWLQEGFATYYAILAERELFGNDHFNWALYQMAELLQQAAQTDKAPILDEKASSLTYYQKGAWALHALCEGVGKENFRKAVKAYLEKYAFKNVGTDQFLAEINKVSDYDTALFKKQWLESPGFEIDQAIAILKKNTFMKDYFNLLALQETPFGQKEEVLQGILKSASFYPLKEEAVFQAKEVPFEEKKVLLELALQTNDIHVRQAVANMTDTISIGFYKDYATLLDDPSYITKEMALGKLWSQYPEKQIELLDKTRNSIGLNDKNLRIQWLTLSLLTKEFEPKNKIQYYEELLDYTRPGYESSIRQNAIVNLLFLDPNDTNVLQSLVSATIHHKWQFTKYARDKIRSLLKKEKYKTFYIDLLPKLPQNEQAQLNKLLKE